MLPFDKSLRAVLRSETLTKQIVPCFDTLHQDTSKVVKESC